METSNSSINIGEIPELSIATKASVTLLTIITFSVSCIGNSLVIHVIRRKQLLKSTTYLLILNMACGDLVASIFACPSLIRYLYSRLAWLPGKFGGILCKINLYVVLVAFLGCIFSLVGMTVDRYLAVSRPLKHKPWTTWSKISIPVIWVLAVLLPINSWNEIGIVYEDSGDTFCVYGNNSVNTMITLATCFLLPFTVMLVLHPIISYRLWTRRIPGESSAQQRVNLVARKVTKTMIAVALSFFFCWTPQFVFVWIYPFAPEFAVTLPYDLMPFIVWLETLNCALNPVLYGIFNESFRKGFKEVIYCRVSRHKNLQIPPLANSQGMQNLNNIALVNFHTNSGMEK